MQEAMYFLKGGVYFEPLFNKWYAWPYLLPPVQGARHTVNTHLRIMKSFVANYKLHIMACKEPGLTGGEFLDCTEEQVQDIRSLIDHVETNCRDLLGLSEAVMELEEILRNHVGGESVEPLYAKIPEPLKGYVELFFDMEHNASYRLFESLLYKSPYYKEELQSVSFGLLSKVQQRPFVLSTPRIADEHHLHLNLPFNSPVLKRILAAREKPLTKREMDDLFAASECAGGLDYAELFTTEPPKRYQPPKEGVRLQYTGHAGFLIETPETAVLIDPVIATLDDESDMKMVSFSDLPDRIDFVCLTHNHQDHVNFETLLQLRHKTDRILVPKNNGGSLADPSLKLLLQQFGFKVSELEDLEVTQGTDLTITSLPFMGEHGDLNIRSKSAWLLEVADKKLFFGADSSNIDPNMYTHLQKVIGNVDLLAIGMECVGAPYTWLYGALHTRKVSKQIKESRRLNGADAEMALNMIELFKPQQVYIYALGLEPCYKYFMGIDYDDDAEQLKQSGMVVNKCQDIGIIAEALNGSKIIEFRD